MRKRVLFCVPNHSAFIHPITAALISMGYEVKIFDYQKGNTYSRVLSFVTNNVYLLNTRFQPIIFSTKQTALLNLTRTWKPDLLLTIKGETISRDTLKELKRMRVKTVNWYPDWLIFWDWIKIHAPLYTLFASSCLNTHKKLQQITGNSIYLPYAACADKQLYIGPKKYDVTFVGQYTPRRERLFSAIADLGLSIWGYSRWSSSKLQHLVQPAISVEKTLQVFRESKIVVNALTGGDDFQPHTVNLRTFETLGVGTLLLVYKHPVYKRHFDIGKDFIVFSDEVDLRKKTLYYLHHTAARNKIAKTGWSTVIQKHTYPHRLKLILNKLSV